ncbi:MAG: hypothetical protein ACF8PG_03865 [Maioricimonas sp. JB045]
MNCQDFLQHVEDELLSHPEAAVASLRAHLADCDQTSCREFLENTLAIEEAVRVWRDQTPQVDVTGTVLTRWKTEAAVPDVREPVRPSESPSLHRATPDPTPPPASRAWPVVLAVALLMLTLPLLVPGRSGKNDRAGTGPVTAVEPSVPSPTPSPNVADAEQHTAVVRDRSIAYYNAAQHATRMVTDAVVLVLPDDDPSSQFEDPTHVPEWVGHWGEQIEPLKTQFDSAVRSLMNVLPEPMPAT